jgi:hypothetical protein
VITRDTWEREIRAILLDFEERDTDATVFAIAKAIKQRWGLKLLPSYGAISLHLLRMRQAEQVAQLHGEVGYVYRLAGAGRELARQEHAQNAQKALSAGT